MHCIHYSDGDCDFGIRGNRLFAVFISFIVRGWRWWQSARHRGHGTANGNLGLSVE